MQLSAKVMIQQKKKSAKVIHITNLPKYIIKMQSMDQEQNERK